MLDLLLVGLLAPLVGFILLFLLGNRLGRTFVGTLGCLTILISFVCFSALFWLYSYHGSSPLVFRLYPWIPVEGIHTDFSLVIDPLSLLMVSIISGVGFLIHCYSVGYMDHEKDVTRFFAFLNFFVFSMLLLVLAGNLLLLFVGWEGVGLASYFLIGFWYERPAAAQAATKAFVVNRIGDLGLLLGILLTFYLFGTTDIQSVLSQATQGLGKDAPILIILTLLYFIGATGKSAQLPLHTWLPDAMEGPTPVSALIHAATMVTAGVYLVVRMHALFLLAPETLYIIAFVGALTSLFAAVCAIGQNDLKRVLAYSTISQLGLMFLACGVGAFFAAMFHLTMHAFMKALLFLSAGNVLHMTHETTDMNKMGGLQEKMPRTGLLFLTGVLAMAGIPPLAAFFSKDLILEETFQGGYDLLFFIGWLASALTAYYLTRAYCLTFRGPSQLEEKIKHIVKEAPQYMLAPLSVLAVLSILGGFLGFSLHHPPPFEQFLAEIGIAYGSPKLAEGFHLSFSTWFALFGALLGVGLSAYVYTKYREALRTPVSFMQNGFYINELYHDVIVTPLRWLAVAIANFSETYLLQGSLRLISTSTDHLSKNVQRLQNGQIRSYIAWMAVGMVLLIVFFTF